MIEQRPELETIPSYQPGKSQQEVRTKTQRVIKLASNENPLGSSVNWTDLKGTYETINRYSNPSLSPLKKAISDHVGLTEEHVILGNGSGEIIQYLGAAFLKSSDEVISVDYTFALYQWVTALFGATFKQVPLKDYQFDVPAILKSVTPQTKLICLASPNNPTGCYLNKDALIALMDQIPNQVLVLIDEAYIEFATAADVPNSPELIKTYPNLCLLRTFSKAYGLAGLRLGYGLANPRIIKAIEKVRLPFNVNALSLKAGVLALQNQAFIDKSVIHVHKERERLIEALRSLPLRTLPSQANFLCIVSDEDLTGLTQSLESEGIIVRHLKQTFQFPNAIRVSIGNNDENSIFVEKITEIKL